MSVNSAVLTVVAPLLLLLCVPCVVCCVRRLCCSVDFLHPKGGSLSDKAAVAPAKLRIVKPATVLQPHRRSRSRRPPSTSSASATPVSTSLLSTSTVDSLSLTSTSTFPAAYTAPASPKQKQHTRRSVSSSALPSPTRSSTAAIPPAASVAASVPSSSSLTHQRAHTAEELSTNPATEQPSTPRQQLDSSSGSTTPPHSPHSAGGAIHSTPPPTVRRATQAGGEQDVTGHDVSEREADKTKRMDGEADEAGQAGGDKGDDGDEEVGCEKRERRLEDGEEESEELTNTTLADASLPESDDGDDRRRRRQNGEGGRGAGSGGDGGNGGGDPGSNDSANDSTDAINDILSFMRHSILTLSSAAPTTSPPTIDQLSGLSASSLLTLYKSVLTPVLLSHSELSVVRDEVSALRVKVKEVELAGLRECKRQVERAKAEVEAKYADELRRLKEKQRDRKAAKDASRRSGEKCNTTVGSTATTGTSGRHNFILANVSYINHSLSFHDMSIDPTLSLTTDMLEPRTVTFTLSTLDLCIPTAHSNVTLALFSSRLACHSLWNFVGQTESRLPLSAGASCLTFDRRLVMREVKTWHARDKLRVSAYWVALQRAGGEERKEMMGQVECDTYKLFTAFSSQSSGSRQSVAWEALKAQETTDAIQGYSVRQLCVPLVDEHGMQCGSTRLLIHAHITPPLTCDSYPPSPERVKRAGRAGALHIDSSLNLSLINDSHAHFNHSLAAPSFIENEPLSPIYPTKHAHADSDKAQTEALDRTQRETETARTDTVNIARVSSTSNQCAATQSEAMAGVECGAQTDTPLVVRRVYRDAGTMTDEPTVQAKPALTVCTQEPFSVQPSLKIVTNLEAAVGGHNSCDNSPVVFHQESSGCSSTSPSSPHHASSVCSSVASSPTSAAALLVAAALLPTSASPLQATLMTLSTALSVPFPLPQAKLSTACQQSLHRIIGLLRRQYSSSLQWFLDTAATAPTPANTATTTVSTKQANKAGTAVVSGSGASNTLKPTWNPSINPSAPSRLLSSIRLHSHWQPDSSVTSCSHCQSSFSLLKRKHHCRLCGSTACDECSKKSVELGELGLPGLQRVCDVCEIVWSAGKGLKASGMPVVLLEVSMAPQRDDEAQSTHKPATGRAQSAAGAGKSRKRSVDDGRQVKSPLPQQQQHEDELNVSAADKLHLPASSLNSHTVPASAHSTPTAARTARLRPTPAKRVSDKEREACSAAATPTAVRRVTRSAAKENANTLNVPAAIPEATPRRAAKAKPAAALTTATATTGSLKGGRQ